MFKKVAIGAGAAGVLSAGVLLGGLTTGFVGAQTPHQRAAQAQATPASPTDDAETPDGTGEEAPVSLPAGSVTADQASQNAATYIQQTAPFSTQGLHVQSVQVEDENGTVVYKVTFTGGGATGVEVTESAQGQVLGAKSETADASDTADSGTDASGASEQEDGPGGHADAPGAVDSQGGTQQ